MAKERLHALYLLSHFTYFGNRQMRTLLKAMYRDLYRYPVIEGIRKANHDTLDRNVIEFEYQRILQRSRFLGIGNPSESGSHLLYYFRQENALPKSQFIHVHQIFDRRGDAIAVKDMAIGRYIFIDDFCGSGVQGVEYSNQILEELKKANPDAKCEYHVLFATQKGLEVLRSKTKFDRIGCIYELDDSFKCFGALSRYFIEKPDAIDKEFAREMCARYGSEIVPAAALGFGDCQLLLGLHHNTPDNTLPIFWYDEPGGKAWMPIFKRYSKYYGWSSP